MNENNEKITLGKFLSNKLEEKGFTVKDIYEKTKISKKYLRIILNDDFENYPPLVYLKGFLKKIAEVLEIDYKYINDEFLKDLEKDSSEINPNYEPKISLNEEKSPFRFLIFFILLIIILVIIFFVLKQKNKSLEKEVFESSKVEKNFSKTIVKDNISRLQKKLKKTILKDNSSKIKINENNTTIKSKKISKDNYSNIAKEKPGKKIKREKNKFSNIATSDNVTKTLKIFAKELTWIRVTVDNKTKKTLYLKKGDNVTFEGKNNFKLDIGNAGGIIIKFNNKDLGSPGKKGEVKHIILK